jgi:hypothetical protein
VRSVEELMEELAGYDPGEEDASAIDAAPPERTPGWLERLIDVLPNNVFDRRASRR